MAARSIIEVAEEIFSIVTRTATEYREELDLLSIHSINLSTKLFEDEIAKVKAYVDKDQTLLSKSSVLDGVTSEDLGELLRLVSTSTSTVKKSTIENVQFDTLRTNTKSLKDSILDDYNTKQKELGGEQLDHIKYNKFSTILKNIQIGHASSSALTEKYKNDIAQLNLILKEIIDSSATESVKRKSRSLVLKVIQQLRLSLIASTAIDRGAHLDISDKPSKEAIASFFNRKLSYLSKKGYETFKGRYLNSFATITMLRDNLNSGKPTQKIETSLENWIDNGLKGQYAKATSQLTNGIIARLVYLGVPANEQAAFRKKLERVNKQAVKELDKLSSKEQVLIAKFEKQLQDPEQITGSPSFADILQTKTIDAILGIKSNSSSSKRKITKTVKTKGVETSTKLSVGKKLKVLKPPSVVPVPPIRLRSQTGAFQSVSNLEALIRMSLYETIKKNMYSPALNFQTGRFAESVELKSISYDNRAGAVTAFLTYMKYPYATFEPGGDRGSIDRSPSSLIIRSVREIATKLTKARMQAIII